ncbi:hypothetical protein VDS42_19110 [Xanthomonas campestris pv. campestris]|nr:hypothetical protein [Xanthomonas campestris pv. campestris]
MPLDPIFLAHIRSVVAERHNVLLSSDDPILVTVTINELVLERVLQQMFEKIDQAMNSANELALTNAASAIEAAKQSAGRLITDAAKYSEATVAAAGEEAGRKVLASLDGLTSDLKRISEDVRADRNDMREMKRAGSIAIWISAVAAALAIGAALASFLSR